MHMLEILALPIPPYAHIHIQIRIRMHTRPPMSSARISDLPPSTSVVVPQQRPGDPQRLPCCQPFAHGPHPQPDLPATCFYPYPTLGRQWLGRIPPRRRFGISAVPCRKPHWIRQVMILLERSHPRISFVFGSQPWFRDGVGSIHGC